MIFFSFFVLFAYEIPLRSIMKILSASTHQSDEIKHLCQLNNNVLTTEYLLLNDVLTVCKDACDKAHCLPSEIDAIVSLSLSPNHLAISSEIAGPRIGHPLQRALNASNAYVFDMMDSSTAKTLHIADIFTSTQRYKRILFIRAECNLGSKNDQESGFSIPNGIMAFIAQPTGLSQFKSTNINSHQSNNKNGMVVLVNPLIQSENDYKTHIKFSPPENLHKTSLAKAKELAKQLNNEHFILENWNSPHPEESIFNLGFSIEKKINSHHKNASNKKENIALISFDPFNMSLDAITVEYGFDHAA